MTDDNEDEPAIELGEGGPVEGAPIARVSARLMWGIEKSTIVDREGETSIRTPDGPRTLGDILDEVDHTYFDTRQSFEDAVREVVGTGPVPTAGAGSDEEAIDDAEDVADDEAAESTDKSESE
jgi:hypothetical protein